jgi:hypothetical protein
MHAGVAGSAQGHGGVPSLNGYYRRNLVAQLLQRGRVEDAARLLRLEKAGAPVWYTFRRESDEERGYESDVSATWRAADERFGAATDVARRAAAIDQQIFCALVVASLHDSSSHLSLEALDRHLRSGEWTAERASVAAARVPDAAIRAAMFGVIAGTEPAAAHGIVVDALGDPDRLTVLSSIVQHLPSPDVSAVVATVRASGADDDAVADAMVASSSRLDGGEAWRALSAALGELRGPARARAVAALLPRADMGPEQVETLVEQLLGDLGDAERTAAGAAVLDVLEATADRMSVPAAVRSLESLAVTAPSVRRARVAVMLAAGLPARRRARALAAEGGAADRIRPRVDRAVALATLGLTEKALAVARGCAAAERAPVIAAIAPLLRPEAAADAMKLVAELPSAQARCDTLIALVPVISSASTTAALRIVEGVSAPRARARMLHALAPVLPEQRLTRALLLALAISDVRTRGVALARLEPRLTARHRAIPRYRRRGAVTVDADALLQAWADAPHGRPSAPAADVPSTGPGVTPSAAPHVMSPADRADGDASVLPAGKPTESSALQQLSDVVHAALGPQRLDWFRSMMPEDQQDIDLVPTPPVCVPPPPGAVRKAPSTLRRVLGPAIRDRHVELSDPHVVAALDTVDAVKRRTALHLGLQLAEVCDRDDKLHTAPGLTVVMPAFAAHGRLGEALDAARELTGPYRRCEALTAALPYVPDGGRRALAAEAWDLLLIAARASSPRMWLFEMHVVHDLLPLVSPAAVARLARVLRTLAGEPGETGPPPDVLRSVVVQVQLAMLMHAGRGAAPVLAADGLRTAAGIGPETVRTAVLAAFTPVLPHPALHAAVTQARRLRNVHRRAEALAALAERAHGVRDASLATDIVVHIADLPGAGGDPEILALLASKASLVPPVRLAVVWCPAVGRDLILRHPANTSRDALCAGLAAFRPVLAKLGGRRVTAAIPASIKTVTRWWP